MTPSQTLTTRYEKFVSKSSTNKTWKKSMAMELGDITQGQKVTSISLTISVFVLIHEGIKDIHDNK